MLEIASNDGSHLSCLAARGLDVMGIDPARNLNDIAAAAGHKVLTGFFPDVRPDGRFDVVVAMNVAAHTPTPLRFLAGVADVLAPGGVAIVQTSQALMLGNGEFDTVYHEHYSFFTVASMRALAARAGLRLEQVQLVAIHGTSLLLFLRRADESGPAIAFKARTPLPWPGRTRSPHFCRRPSAARRPRLPMSSSRPRRTARWRPSRPASPPTGPRGGRSRSWAWRPRPSPSFAPPASRPTSTSTRRR